MKFKKVNESTYNTTKGLVDILRNSETRKELLKRGYDPSVKPTQRVVNNKVLKSTKESEGNPYVREYINEDAVKKTNNDRILNEYLTERKQIDKDNIQGFDDKNEKTHYRVVRPSKTYKYHGYVDNGSNKFDINGDQYKLNIDSELDDKNPEVEFGTVRKDGFTEFGDVINKPANIDPLFRKIADDLNKNKAPHFNYNSSYCGDDSKHTPERRMQQRSIFYDRKFKRYLPGLEINKNSDSDNGYTANTKDVDWRKLATQ